MMNFLWPVLSLLSLLALLHTYLLYPLLLKWLAGRSSLPVTPPSPDRWPQVSVLMSLYNEEKVIAQKLQSLLELDYPADRLQIFIGSDGSSDRTDQLVEDIGSAYPNWHFFAYHQRRGKPSVLNDLAAEALRRHPPAAEHVLLITDANVLLDDAVLKKLTRHFQDPGMALVDARMVNTGLQASGISRSEDQYISREVQIKNWEGLLWGVMIGPFGGCYALRSDYFRPVPPHFLVDDFFLAMTALEKGGACRNDLEARCYEAVSHDLWEEYKRKRRIAGGNYQNLLTFTHLWFPPVGKLRFAFFSHKVLRWLGPFWILLFVTGAGLSALTGNLFFRWLFLVQLGAFLGLPFLDWILSKRNIHWKLLRNVRYFLFMNLALLEGFFNFLKGIKGGTWEPPKRV